MSAFKNVSCVGVSAFKNVSTCMRAYLTLFKFNMSSCAHLAIKNCHKKPLVRDIWYLCMNRHNLFQFQMVHVVSQSILQVCHSRRWALFQVFPHILTTKERPCHVYSNSMPLKQIIIQIIANNKGFEVNFWPHITLWTAHHVTMNMRDSLRTKLH